MTFKTMAIRLAAAGCMLLAAPAMAQITVLDSAQDARAPVAQDAAPEPSPPPPPPPPPPCGSQPLTIARMSWPSAALLAEIHAAILTRAFDCSVRITAGDLAATASSMGSSGQPSVAPEMWATRIADVWNNAIEGQMVRSAAPTYAASTFEGWFIPAYMASGEAVPAAAELANALPPLAGTGRVRLISCPADWGCAIINANLVRAHGLESLVEVVTPANRFEMDTLIAEAISRREAFLTYYWQPNAVLAQLDFVALDMGPYDEAAAKCLADRNCADPQPSAFPGELVVTAVADRLFADAPAIVGYFQRATMPFAEMNSLLAWLNEPEADVESVAARFVAERRDFWSGWVGE